MNYTFHWLPAFRALPDMLWGALVTLEIAVLSMVLGVLFAVLLAVGASSRYRVFRAAAASWVELARNTPALFQIYMAYFGLGSLGMGQIQAFRLVVMPQMFRIVFYPMTNQMVWAILMTSLGVIVGLNNDLTGVTQEYNVRSFRTFEYFALAAVIYYLLAKFVTMSARLLAWRLFRY